MSATTTTTSTSTTTSTTSRLPVLFLSHGAGPCFYMDKSESNHPVFNNVHKDSEAAAWYRQISTQLHITTPPDTITDATERLKWQKPKAILVISAHWESKDAQLKVTTQERYPSLLYDYGGFPEHTYRIQWPAPGAPMLAKQVQSLLAEKGFIVSGDEKRNLDHGTFIPLGLVYPAADIPTIQLTVQAGLNPENHLKIGEALAPLREQGVLIVGSGSTTHGRFTHSSHGREWVNALTNVLTKENSETRRDALVNWIKLPHAREAHGREEHLIPLHVAVGAAGNDVGTKIGDFWAGDMSIASYAFGA